MASIFNFLSNAILGILRQLGFLNKEATLVLIGLDNAGKTTLQYRLRTGKLKGFLPTERAQQHTVTLGSLTLHTWDLGGHAPTRYLWSRYSAQSDGIVFMLDAAEPSRFPEAKTELHKLAKAQGIQDIPIAVIANKCDIEEAASNEALIKALALNDIGVGTCQLFRVSVYRGEGYVQAFQWLSEYI